MRYDRRMVGCTAARRARCALLCLLAVPLAGAARGEEWTCSAEQPFPGHGTYEATLKLEVAGGDVVGLSFDGLENFTDTGNPMAVWACGVDTADAAVGGLVRWTRRGSVTEVAITDRREPDERSLVTLQPHDGGIAVRFLSMTGYFCGNARFPAVVWIRKGDPRCRLTLAPAEP
jgi:hypothetical protein